MEHISKNQVKYVRSLQQKKVRDAESVFVAEGHRCIEELIRSFDCHMLITSLSSQDTQTAPTSLWEATTTEIEQMSSMRTPQGEIAVFKRPAYSLDAVQPEKELVLVLDGVQDPGNLGTIIRTADWFGIRDIVCSNDTADCWNPKVVQATMGALARVRVHYTNLPEWIGEVRGCSASVLAAHVPVYGTLLDGKNMYEDGAIPQRDHGIIIMGNEGNGISAEVRRLITHPLYIPSYKNEAVESLNVGIATAIILAEFRR